MNDNTCEEITPPHNILPVGAERRRRETSPEDNEEGDVGQRIRTQVSVEHPSAPTYVRGVMSRWGAAKSPTVPPRADREEGGRQHYGRRRPDASVGQPSRDHPAPATVARQRRRERVAARDALLDRSKDVATIADLEAFAASIAAFFGEDAWTSGTAARARDRSARLRKAGARRGTRGERGRRWTGVGVGRPRSVGRSTRGLRRTAIKRCEKYSRDRLIGAKCRNAGSRSTLSTCIAAGMLWPALEAVRPDPSNSQEVSAVLGPLAEREVDRRLRRINNSAPGPDGAETRWNSLFDSLQQIHSIKEKNVQLHRELGIKKPIKCTEFDHIQEYLMCAAPVAEALDIMQGENNMYFGIVLPCLFALRKKLKTIKRKNNLTYCKTLIETYINSVETRFSQFYDLNTPEAESAAIAALSHSRFKNKWLSCVEPTQRNKVLNIFKINISKEINKNPEVAATRTTKNTKKEISFFNFNTDSDSENLEMHSNGSYRMLTVRDGAVRELAWESLRGVVGCRIGHGGSFMCFADWRFIHKSRLNVLPLNGARRWETNDKRCRQCGRHLFMNINGPTSGSTGYSGPIGKILKGCRVSSLRIVSAIKAGEMPENVAHSEPGTLNHSRWLTTANRILRLYVSTWHPGAGLKLLVNFILKVYAPSWFHI
ncbi:hypothetical protein ALC57_09880 [Trachymyrmex cornetzi]|uniref:Uncharacterized protein n=1 Tax=Trachymyrmex cornetzi TaxID=471704 RepID=A0A151J4Z0_9HYME|nr:hypothetical protein ALC57_09880 [Trachymyrmex cornetzi]